MAGLGLQPQSHDPFVDRIDEQALRTHFQRLRSAIAQTVAAMPEHGEFIERYAKAEPVSSPAQAAASAAAAAAEA
jgi:tryptophan halogenase